MVDPTAKQTQPRELNRVARSIAPIVWQFCKENEGGVFTMPMLEEYVSRYLRVTPGSPGRILRMLRKEGYVGYDVVNRRHSAYAVRWVKALPKPESAENA